MATSKADMIELMAGAADISKAAAEKAYNAFVQGVIDGVKSGSVTLVGFGTFKISHRKARTGVNPRTGEKIQISASNAIVFKAGKKAKEEVNR
jgi:nucleoid DNA-binding protein